jgi:hypothetical protein
MRLPTTRNGGRREEASSKDGSGEGVSEMGGGKIIDAISAKGIDAVIPLSKRIW